MKLEIADFSELPHDVPAALMVHGQRMTVLLNPSVDREQALDAAEAILIHWQASQ